jgi:hypothetical protein
MAVLYFLIVFPYKAMMARPGETVFGDPAPAKTCPAGGRPPVPTELYRLGDEVTYE